MPYVQRMGAKSKQKTGDWGEEKCSFMSLCSSTRFPRVYILCSLKLFELGERSPPSFHGRVELYSFALWPKFQPRLLACGRWCRQVFILLRSCATPSSPSFFSPSSFFPYHCCWMLNRPRFFYCTQKEIVTHTLMDRYISNGGSLWMKIWFFLIFFFSPHLWECVFVCAFSCSLKKEMLMEMTFVFNWIIILTTII
jgi:hypothetical protein